MKILRIIGDGFLWLEPFWIALLAPSLLLRDLLWDPWVHPWLILALFAFWPFRLLFTGRLAPATPVTWPAFCLLLWTPVGLINAINWERSWHAVGFIAFGVALFFALLNWPPVQRWPWLIAAFLGMGGIGLALLGPMILPRLPQEFFIFSEDLARSKPTDFFNAGETINPNILAGALLLPIPLLMALALRFDIARQRWLPPLLLLPTSLILAALLLAQSRGAYLAAFLSLLLVITLRWPWAGVISLIGSIAAGSVLSLEGVVLLMEAIGSDGSVTSMSGRWEIWTRAVQAIGDFALTGIGIDSFEYVIPALYPYVEIHTPIPHAHNLLLQVGVDLGLPGLLFYCWLWGAALWIFIAVLRTSGVLPDSEEINQHHRRGRRRSLHRQAVLRLALASGALCAIVAMVVHGMVDAVTWGTKLAFLSWLLLALAGALYLQAQQSDDDPQFDL
jgi:putative inorganic carbon (HCO3(-)) transporter